MKNIILFAVIIFSIQVAAQNDRLNDYNDLVWAQLFTNFKLSEKVDLLAEYQWRRTNGTSHWQQGLFRTGIQLRSTPQLSFAAGYAYIDTYPYGDYPIAANGTFPERRTHQQVQYRHSFGRLSATQRIRIEQRFIGRKIPSGEIDEWLFSHRFRHLLRLQLPFSSTATNSPYIAAADELFVQAGKDVGVNIFDQNRLMLIIGKRMSNNVVLEAGYINQTLMQGRRINARTIVQRNNGLMLTTSLNF